MALLLFVIQVSVVTLDSSTASVDVSADATIEDLRDAVAEQTLATSFTLRCNGCTVFVEVYICIILIGEVSSPKLDSCNLHVNIPLNKHSIMCSSRAIGIPQAY